MKRFFLALVCAATVWLVPLSAHAEMAFWKCSASLTTVHKDGRVVKNGVSREFKAESETWAIAMAKAYWERVGDHAINPVRSKVAENIRCTKPAMSAAKIKQKNHYETPYVPPPPIPVANTNKPITRVWSCRVKLRWHVGPRYGDVDETWSDIEAPSEAAAMGLAIQRSQSRLKALMLAGTNPTWSKTEASCS